MPKFDLYLPLVSRKECWQQITNSSDTLSKLTLLNFLFLYYHFLQLKDKGRQNKSLIPHILLIQEEDKNLTIVIQLYKEVGNDPKNA